MGYDALRSFGSPSYFAFQMFSRNRGDQILKASMVGAPFLTSVTRDSKTGAIFVKHVNPEAVPQTVQITIKGVRSVASTATAILLSADPGETNSIDAPATVVPVTRSVSGIAPLFTYTFPAYSIVILRLDTRVPSSSVRAPRETE
jgi:alpha-N-arabinofuranosidase